MKKRPGRDPSLDGHGARSPSAGVAPGLIRLVDGGLHVPGLDWWLDATEPRDVGFISHAHSDHMARHERIVCTPETAALLAVWFDAPLPPCERLQVDDWRTVGDVRARLLPSGHILGGAMVHVEAASGSALYAGDVRLGGSQTCPPARLARADLLVIEDTFGAVDEPLPDSRAAVEAMLDLVRRYREQGRTPVLVTLSNCGKAQDAVAALCAAGFAPALQTKLWRFTEAYRALGRVSGGYRKLLHDRKNDCDVCLVTRAYLGFRGGDLSAMVADPVTILLSGWAATDERLQYDESVPWSDHASREELLDIVRTVAPREVWTFAGSGRLARELRAAGVEARHLEHRASA
jgi:hypothetical protein